MPRRRTPRSAVREMIEGEATDANGEPANNRGPPVSDEVSDWSIRLDGIQVSAGRSKELESFDLLAESGEMIKCFDIFTITELMKRQFPAPNWVVPGILSEGLNVLAGRPKLGKSMMALNLGMTIAGGGKALGNIQTQPGDVLYLSLEDRERRVQSRARFMVRGLDCEITDRLSVATIVPSLGQGGLKFIDVWMHKVEKPTLLIVDVWTKFKPAYTSNGSQYEQDYRQLSALKTFCQRFNCTVLVLLHCRKGKSEDVLEEVSGTMGLTGVADGIIVLNRSRNSKDAKIFVTGRDVQDHELALQFDDETLTWRSLGSAEEVLTGKLQIKIVDYLKRHEGEGMFVKTICDAIGEDDGSVRRVLHRLADRYIVRRVGNAWTYPGGEERVVTPFDEQA